MFETVETKAVTTIEDFIGTTEPHVFYEVWKTEYTDGEESFATWRYDMEMGSVCLLGHDASVASATNTAVHDARIHGWL